MLSGFCTISPRTANVLIISAFCSIFAAIFFASGPPPDRKDGRLQLNFWVGWVGDELDALQKLVDEYNAAHPDVYIKMVSVANSYQKVKIAFAGGDTPDVCAAIWSEELVDYAVRETLIPLDSFLVKSERAPDDYPPAIWDAFRYQGRTYALAMSQEAQYVAYNKRIFREAGLDPERPPRTLEEFERAAQQCTRYRFPGPGAPLEQLGFSYDNALYWCMAFGVDFWDEERQEVLPGADRMIDCLAWMKEQVNRYGYLRGQAFATTFGHVLSPNNPFISGKVAMQIVGDWYYQIIEQYAPNDFEWGWFPLPVPEQGKERASFLGGSQFVIPRASRHPTEAWKFLEWITSEYGILHFRIGDAPMSAPALRSAYQGEEFQTPYWRFIHTLYESPNASGPPKFPLFLRFLSELFRTQDYVFSGRKTPEEAVAELKSGFQAEVREYLLNTCSQ